MKTCFVLFLSLIGATYARISPKLILDNPVSNKTITDETLRKLLEFFRSLVTPVEEIPFVNITMNTPISLNCTVKNGTIMDLTNFETLETHADMVNLNFVVRIQFPSLNVSGLYSISADSDVFQLVGDGPFSLNATNIVLAANLSLGLKKDKTLELKDLLVDYEDGPNKILFENLGGNAEISTTLNDLINVVLPDLLIATKPDVQEMVKEKAKGAGGFIFGKMTVQQFVDFIYEFIKDDSGSSHNNNFKTVI